MGISILEIPRVLLYLLFNLSHHTFPKPNNSTMELPFLPQLVLPPRRPMAPQLPHLWIHTVPRLHQLLPLQVAEKHANRFQDKLARRNLFKSANPSKDRSQIKSRRTSARTYLAQSAKMSHALCPKRSANRYLKLFAAT